MGRTADRHGFSIERMLYLAAGFGLFAWFLFVVRGGLASWFDADDLMNLHYYWSRPWPALLKANLVFWSSYYRPGGGLFYRSIYALWGFHPLPFQDRGAGVAFDRFRAAGRSGAAAYRIALGRADRLVSDGHQPGLRRRVLRYRHHLRRSGLYFLLGRRSRCTCIFASRGRYPVGGPLALLLCLFVAALDAKEIAVSLPVAVGLYELVWHPPASWRFPELWRWVRRGGPVRSHRRIGRHRLCPGQEVWPGVTVDVGCLPAAVFGARLFQVAVTLSAAAYLSGQ